MIENRAPEPNFQVFTLILELYRIARFARARRHSLRLRNQLLTPERIIHIVIYDPHVPDIKGHVVFI